MALSEFDLDVLERKRLSSQSRHMKRGSKSKKCPMSTDHMTRRQWEKRCGEVLTYKMDSPVTWDEFKGYPANIKREYINGLIQRFSVTATDLAEMFGVASATVLKVCKESDVGVAFTRGKRMTREQREMFDAFCGSDQSDGTEVICEVEPEENAQIIPVGGGDGMAMRAFSIEFDGKFDREMIYNSMAFMLPPDANVRMEIRCEILR